LTSEDFKSTLLEFFASDAEASAALEKEVDWEKWFHAPGLPPKPDFDTSLADVCYNLADKWHGLNTDSSPSGGWTPGPKDIESWTSGQIVVFLEKITDFEKPLKTELVETMINQYGFMKSKNAEILSRMLIVGLKAKDPKLFQPAAEALGNWGRMKFVRPLYRLLNECDRELAVKTFNTHINFYHPICRDVVKKDLKLE
jgi:leukotriene-A4 hydrolase